MTTNQLARYYQTLTPWERLPLLVAACQRGDAVVVRWGVSPDTWFGRLIATSSLAAWTVGDAG